MKVEGLISYKGGRSDAEVDVVFVHGLGGSARGTWSKTRRRWLRPWKKDVLFNWPATFAEHNPHIRVWSLEYGAPWSQWGPGVPMAIYDRAGNVVEQLQVKGVGVDRPLLFVAHSLGGLVVKKILDLAAQKQGTNPQYADLIRATWGVVFIATPHEGSHLVPIVRTLSRLNLPGLRLGTFTLGMFLRLSRLVHRMEPDNPEIRALKKSYCRIASEVGLYTLSFAEEVPILGTLVVSRSSADPGTGETISLPYNHFEVCKPSTRTDLVYDRVDALVSELIVACKPILWIDNETALKHLVARLPGTYRRAVSFAPPPEGPSVLTELILKEQPAGVILDYEMKPSGLDVLGWLHNQWPELPIVVYSQHAGSDKTVSAIHAQGAVLRVIRKDEPLIAAIKRLRSHLRSSCLGGARYIVHAPETASSSGPQLSELISCLKPYPEVDYNPVAWKEWLESYEEEGLGELRNPPDWCSLPKEQPLRVVYMEDDSGPVLRWVEESQGLVHGKLASFTPTGRDLRSGYVTRKDDQLFVTGEEVYRFRLTCGEETEQG